MQNEKRDVQKTRTSILARNQEEKEKYHFFNLVPKFIRKAFYSYILGYNELELHKKLLDAIKNDDLYEVFDCIKKGTDLNKCTNDFNEKTAQLSVDDEYKPLEFAALNNSEDSADILLKYRAKQGNAIFHTLEPKKINMLEKFIQYDNEILELEYGGDKSTPLMISIYNSVDSDTLKIFEVLLKNSSHVALNKENKNGNNALHIALKENKETIIKKLLKNKLLDINSKNKNSESPIYYLFQNYEKLGDYLDSFLNRSDLSVDEKTLGLVFKVNSNNVNTKLLSWALLNNKAKTILHLKNLSNIDYKKVLMNVATLKDGFEFSNIDFLIDKVNDKNILNKALMILIKKRGNNLFYQAIEKILDKLDKKLDAGLVVDEYGNTLLHVVAHDIEKYNLLGFYLHNYERVINKKNFLGKTPLILATASNNTSLINHLLSVRGIQPNLTDTQGNTPVFYANSLKAFNTLATVCDLEHKNIYNETPLIAYCKSNKEMLALEIINKVWNLNEIDSLGNNALFYAIDNQIRSVAKKLLNYNSSLYSNIAKHALEKDMLSDLIFYSNININEQDAYGNTILMLAIKKNYKNIEQLFLVKDLNLYLRNYEGQSALHIAISSNNKNAFSKIVSRMHTGFDTIDNKGNSPLLLSVKNRNYYMTTILLEKECNINAKNIYGESAFSLALEQKNSSLLRKILCHKSFKLDENKLLYKYNKHINFFAKELINLYQSQGLYLFVQNETSFSLSQKLGVSNKLAKSIIETLEAERLQNEPIKEYKKKPVPPEPYNFPKPSAPPMPKPYEEVLSPSAPAIPQPKPSAPLPSNYYKDAMKEKFPPSYKDAMNEKFPPSYEDAMKEELPPSYEIAKKKRKI